MQISYDLTEDDIKKMDQIRAIKAQAGKDLIILTHHYQRKQIVDVGDYCGDSFALSQKAAASPAKYIVFCGVHFMAESAAILAQPYQIVQIPEVEAGCWMADMADAHMIEKAWNELTGIVNGSKVTPLVYVNSDAQIKAFCGLNGGCACTSSNAKSAFKWGFSIREKIFFFPDQYLGLNSAIQIGIPKEEIILWQPDKILGGNTPESIDKAKVILWDGYCLVHTRFKTEHILEMRKKYPEAKIVVHPECKREVVELADAVGSTNFIVNYVKDAPPDSTIIIGTEINLIQRLSIEHKDKKILELNYSLCPNMFKINLDNLLNTLENLGKVNIVTVPENIKAEAKLSLDRMLSLS